MTLAYRMLNWWDRSQLSPSQTPTNHPSRFCWLNWFAVPKGNLLVHLQDICWNIFNNDKSESEAGLWWDEKSRIKISKWMGSMQTVIGTIPTFEHHRCTMHFWKKGKKWSTLSYCFFRIFIKKSWNFAQICLPQEYEDYFFIKKILFFCEKKGDWGMGGDTFINR